MCEKLVVVGTPIPQEGTTSNRYTILGRLAGGGMADILLARATSVGGVERYVVLKRVLPERSRDTNFARMFLDEARLASQLQHPNIAQVYDIGKLAGSYFFTMEYVHGEDVRSLLNRLAGLDRSLPPNNALYIAAGALAALHHAHDRLATDGTSLGIVHRDVSPSNVMLSYEGVIKLLDFGVAKATQRTVETRSGTIKGKIAYLSPEQCKGSPVDRRSDIFSLGVVLHEMLTGRRLFKRDTDFATMMGIVNDDAPPPSQFRSELSTDLDDLVLTALRKEPDRRYATAAEMLEAIESLATREQHVLSATAAGRFLRDLFGERPEPWVEIRVRGDEPKAITITSESISDADALSDAQLASLGAIRVDDDVEDDLEVETQIHETPALWRPDHHETSPAMNAVPILPKQVAAAAAPRPRSDSATGATLPARPRAPSDDGEMDTDEAPPVRPPMPAPRIPVAEVAPEEPPTIPLGDSSMFHSVTATVVSPPPEPEPPTVPVVPPPPPMPIYPAASSYPSASGLTSLTKLVPDLRPAGSRAIVIVVAAVATLGVLILLIKLSGAVDTRDDERVAEVERDATAVPASASAPAPADAAVRIAPVDAAVRAAPVDAAVPAPVHREPTPTIGDAVEAKDWATVLKLCAARKAKTTTERTGCGIAACTAGQRATALSYYRGAGVNQPAIERACKARSITLVASAPPAPPSHPTTTTHPAPPAHPTTPPPAHSTTPPPAHPTTPPPAPPTPPAHPPDPCEADPLKCQK